MRPNSCFRGDGFLASTYRKRAFLCLHSGNAGHRLLKNIGAAAARHIGVRDGIGLICAYAHTDLHDVQAVELHGVADAVCLTRAHMVRAELHIVQRDVCARLCLQALFNGRRHHLLRHHALDAAAGRKRRVL